MTSINRNQIKPWKNYATHVRYILAALLLVYLCHLIALLQSVPSLNSVDCLHHQISPPAALSSASSSSSFETPAAIKAIASSFQNENGKETAAICAIVKDEQLYLEEWVLYNLGLGFDHIYLYDNSPQQTAATWREEFISTPEIRDGTTVVPFLDNSDTRQYVAYRDCMEKFGKKHTWVAIIDVDEFIVLYQHQTIQSLLQQHCQRGSLSLHWLVFGTSQQETYQSEPVTKRFQHITPEHRDSFKSIVRVQDYKNFTYNHHWVELNDNKLRHDTSGDWVELRQLWNDKSKFSSKRKQGKKEFPLDVAVVHHYKYKSVEEYRSKMCDRGDVLNLELCQKAKSGKIPTGDMSKRNDKAYELLLRNVPKYRANTQQQQRQQQQQQQQQQYQQQEEKEVPMNAMAPVVVSKQASNADPSTIFVISMQGTPGVDKHNEGRFDEFQTKWQEACGSAPPTHIEHCPGVFEKRRGYGLTLSWLICLERAKEFNLDVTVIFEDDARLFERSTDFCDIATRKTNYWDSLPSDTFIAFLGGHNWEYPSKEAEESTAQYKELELSFGTYAFAVPRDSLNSLLDRIKYDIVYGFRDKNGKHLHHDFLSPERSWYNAAAKYNKKIYAINPLVIWHEGGFSNTWKKNRASITGEEKETLVNKIRGVADPPKPQQQDQQQQN